MFAGVVVWLRVVPHKQQTVQVIGLCAEWMP